MQCTGLSGRHAGMCAQVCRRWKQVLMDPRARGELWREVIIDFGHELITAVRARARCPSADIMPPCVLTSWRLPVVHCTHPCV
jgi:hypothetical protein